MDTKLKLEILPQPDLMTCGPTCLHAVYRYYGDKVSLGQVIDEVRMLDDGGTMAVMLAHHALMRGYKAQIHTYNLEVFDPSWFKDSDTDIAAKLRAQEAIKKSRRLRFATEGYLDFLAHGGEVLFEDLTPKLIRKYLNLAIPILTGLSATYLYNDMRELATGEYDDLRGEASGHFVVLSGYDREAREVLVADPLYPNPAVGHRQYYPVPIERVIGAIFLGILTYDSNLLVIEPMDEKERG